MLRLWHAFRINTHNWLARLRHRPDRLERRLIHLRAIYSADPDAGLHTRRVRDALRGQVATPYHGYYDRLLRIERAIVDLLRHDVPPGLTTPDLIAHMQTLTERVARLLDQAQRCDGLETLYQDGSPEQSKIREARRLLMIKVDVSMALQESIPVSLLQLSTTAVSTGRNFTRLRDKLDDLKARSADITESYSELDTQSVDILEMSLRHDQAHHYEEQTKTP